METLFFLSVGLNIALIVLFFYRRRPKTSQKSAEKQQPAAPVTEQKTRSVVNAPLRAVAEVCEAKLSEEDRGKVKLLVHKDDTQHLAILQIGELKISLRRNDVNQSLFNLRSFYETLEWANNGYNVKGLCTGRYIPVPEEVEFVLSQRHIINVYLEALGLEQISEKDDFWCVDTETGWNTGWKRFGWSVAKAFEKLHRKARIRTSDGAFLPQVEAEDKAKLFLLLKGWEHLFVEA